MAGTFSIYKYCQTNSGWRYFAHHAKQERCRRKVWFFEQRLQTLGVFLLDATDDYNGRFDFSVRVERCFALRC